MTAISSIRNLGPATEAAFVSIGITTADSLHEMGADAAYLAWLKAGLSPHFIGYYALVLGLQGRPWTDCSPDEKKALRKTFNALKKQAAPEKRDATFEARLNQLGVLPAAP